MKKIYKIILGLFVAFFLFVGLFFWFLMYSSITDISEDKYFSNYLNKPLIIKQPIVIKKNKDTSNYRISKYALENYNNTTFNDNIIKQFSISDTIIFKSVKVYFSNHVGKSYYFIGDCKKENGGIIEFEYSGFRYSPAFWETKNDFLERRKIEEKENVY